MSKGIRFTDEFKRDAVAQVADLLARELSGMHQALLLEQERSGSAWVLELMIQPDMISTVLTALTRCVEVLHEISCIGHEIPIAVNALESEYSGPSRDGSVALVPVNLDCVRPPGQLFDHPQFYQPITEPPRCPIGHCKRRALYHRDHRSNGSPVPSASGFEWPADPGH